MKDEAPAAQACRWRSGFLRVFITPFCIKGFLAGFMLANQRVLMGMICPQLIPGYGRTWYTFLHFDKPCFSGIRRLGRHRSSLFLVDEQ
jgi:hypothetical protein